MFAEMRLRSYVYRPTAAAPGDPLDTPGKSFVRHAELGSDAGILGACLLPFSNDEEALGRSVAQSTQAS
jgi:glucokinase